MLVNQYNNYQDFLSNHTKARKEGGQSLYTCLSKRRKKKRKGENNNKEESNSKISKTFPPF